MKALFTILILLTAYTGFSADGKKQVRDTTYIAEFKDRFSLKLFTIERPTSFTISDTKNNNESIYKPNGSTNFGLGIIFNWIKLGVSFIPIGTEGSVRTHGKTSKFNLQGNIFTKKIGSDLHFQYNRGYYLSNPGSFNPNWTKAIPYPQRRDIRTLDLGASLFFVYNHSRFSFASVYIQSEWQKKSAGSFFSGGSIKIYSVNADSAISPFEAPQVNIANHYFKSARLRGISKIFGYSYTLVISKHLFSNLTLAPGISLNHVKLRDGSDDVVMDKLKIGSNLGLRFGLGYNSAKFFTGFTAVYDYNQITYSAGEGRFGYSSGQARFYIGYRL